LRLSSGDGNVLAAGDTFTPLQPVGTKTIAASVVSAAIG
jgi:hypothetical protein